LLEEMAWLSNDFKEEKKWKIALARKVAKAVDKYWQLEASKTNRMHKEEEARIRKLAASIARDVRTWGGCISLEYGCHCYGCKQAHDTCECEESMKKISTSMVVCYTTMSGKVPTTIQPQTSTWRRMRWT
jgi:hypothetical protein